MIPVNHPNCHREAVMPAGHEGVPLPYEVVLIQGIGFLVSYWRPSPEEIAAITAGAPVKVGLSVRQQPVIIMGVEGESF